MTTKKFILPKYIADILQDDQRILSIADKEFIYPSSRNNFIQEKRVELAVFYSDLFKINQNYSRSNPISRLKRISINPIITGYHQMPFKQLQKLFGANDIVKPIKDFSIEHKIISPLKNVCTTKKYNGEWRETFRATASAQDWAIENGNDPDLAFGQSKSYTLRSNVVNHTKIHGLVNVEYEVPETSNKRIQNYYKYFEEQEYNKSIKLQKVMANKFTMPLCDERLKEIEKICDRDAHKPFQEREIISYKHYQNVFDKKADVYQKHIINRRVITSHALIKKEDLRNLVTDDGYNAVEIDISASKPSFHINMLHQYTDGDSAYKDVFEAVSNGKLYELMIKITGDKYSRKDIKKAYSTVASMPYDSFNWDGMIGYLNKAISKYYPKWMELLKHNSSPEGFKHTFGRSRFNQIDNEKSYDYYTYTNLESWFMQEVINEIIEQLGLIPLTSKYDCIIVGTNNLDEVCRIIKQVSEEQLAVPLHFKIDYFNEDDAPVSEVPVTEEIETPSIQSVNSKWDDWREAEIASYEASSAEATSDDIYVDEDEVNRALEAFKKKVENGEYKEPEPVKEPEPYDICEDIRQRLGMDRPRKFIDVEGYEEPEERELSPEDLAWKNLDISGMSGYEIDEKYNEIFGIEEYDVSEEEVNRALEKFKRKKDQGLVKVGA